MKKIIIGRMHCKCSGKVKSYTTQCSVFFFFFLGSGILEDSKVAI